MSAAPPFVVHFLSPFSTSSLSPTLQVALSPLASLPAPRSLRPNAHRRRPAAMSGRYLRFCSSVPASSSGKDPSAFTAKSTPTPPQARDSSSTTRHRSSTPPPPPPYSLGIHTPMSPEVHRSSLISQGYSWTRS